MMVVYINGQEETLVKNQTIAAWLEANNMLSKRIAVELNGNIVPKSQLTHVLIRERDTIEVIAAIGGG